MGFNWFWAKKFASLIRIGVCVSTMVSVAQAATRIGLNNGFETANDLSNIRLTRSTARRSGLDSTQGNFALRVSFLSSGTKMYPSVTVPLAQTTDLTQCGGIALDIRNPMTRYIEFTMVFVDTVGRKLSKDLVLNAEESGSYRLTHPTLEQAGAIGMKHLPSPFSGIKTLVGWFDPGFDFQNVRSVNLFLRGPNDASVLSLDNLRILPSINWSQALGSSIDAFGQWSHATWPGKLQSNSQFPSRIASENHDLSHSTILSSLDSYGGSTIYLPRTATGFFRTEFVNGKWWLVTPQGNLFFSIGMNNVSANNPTVVTGRESLFSQLPVKNDPLGQFYSWIKQPRLGPPTGAATYDFYKSNLYQKYGSNWNSQWADTTQQRLSHWGFNTIGNWSDGNLLGTGKMPYTATGYSGSTGATISTGLDYWAPTPDPFDPQFAVDLARNLNSVTQKYKSDPYCIGYFVDNEINWVGVGPKANLGISIGTLKKQSSSSPAKQEFLNQLSGKYGTIEALNNSWQSGFSSWASLKGPVDVAALTSSRLDQDLSNFLTVFARRYFSSVRDELKRQDPNHLYLACRFSWYGPEVLAAAAEFSDVLSFNVYARNISARDWSFLGPLNKPAMISEFQFGARDRGLFGPGLIETDSQTGRAQLYNDYVLSAARCPFFVGCHWFQYTDQPTSGRAFDGQNYNIGMVDITDTPYPELTQGCQETNRQVYSARGG